jgi:hypothetical protein
MHTMWIVSARAAGDDAREHRLAFDGVKID